MYQLLKSDSVYGYEHKEVIIDLTKEQKKEIRLLLKELFNYCSENKIKYQVDARDMSLYQYVRGFGLFSGGMQMRQDTINYYDYFTKNTYNADKNICRIYSEIQNVMGEDKFRTFFTELKAKTKLHFKAE